MGRRRKNEIDEYGKYSKETIDNFELENWCMTSLQLAHLKKVRHADMLRLIRKMEETWIKLGEGNFALSSYINEQNKEQPMYQLNKKQTLFVASKFDDELRLGIINRWEALETSKAMPIKHSDDPMIERLQMMIENRQKVIDLELEQQRQAQELVQQSNRLELIEKKVSVMDEIKAKYESGQLTEFEYYISMAKQTINDIASMTKMQFSDIYHGIAEIYSTMPHYCRKSEKKSIFKVMEERKDKDLLALNYYKSVRMFKEKVL